MTVGAADRPVVPAGVPPRRSVERVPSVDDASVRHHLAECARLHGPELRPLGKQHDDVGIVGGVEGALRA